MFIISLKEVLYIFCANDVFFLIHSFLEVLIIKAGIYQILRNEGKILRYLVNKIITFNSFLEGYTVAHLRGSAGRQITGIPLSC